MSLISFYTPWKHKKIRGFLFSWNLERDQWHEIGSSLISNKHRSKSLERFTKLFSTDMKDWHERLTFLEFATAEDIAGFTPLAARPTLKLVPSVSPTNPCLSGVRLTFSDPKRVERLLKGDPRKTSLLILSEFKWINDFLFPQKSSLISGEIKVNESA